MGDRYTLKLDCAYCMAENEEIWYSPTSSVDVFTCHRCGKRNFVACMPFKAMKLEEVALKDVIAGFKFTTTARWTEKQIEEMCAEHLARLKKETK